MISEEQRRERQREYHKRWYQKNKTEACAKSREWHRNNRDKNLATNIHVDHDHTNGQLRDLLCRSCNVGIGLFNDSPLLTTRATEYLSKWKK